VDSSFPAVSARPDFQGAGLEHVTLQSFPAKGRYMWRDLERICADLDLPFRRPEPFPQSSLLAARVALAGLDDTWGEDFAVRYSAPNSPAAGASTNLKRSGISFRT
jgi:2-hydroxychromene-2-carboxylate isomerase